MRMDDARRRRPGRITHIFGLLQTFLLLRGSTGPQHTATVRTTTSLIRCQELWWNHRPQGLGHPGPASNRRRSPTHRHKGLLGVRVWVILDPHPPTLTGALHTATVKTTTKLIRWQLGALDPRVSVSGSSLNKAPPLQPTHAGSLHVASVFSTSDGPRASVLGHPRTPYTIQNECFTCVATIGSKGRVHFCGQGWGLGNSGGWGNPALPQFDGGWTSCAPHLNLTPCYFGLGDACVLRVRRYYRWSHHSRRVPVYDTR